MADVVHRALVCLIAGESEVFKVKSTGNIDIMELKDLIRERGKNGVLSSVGAKDLTLWKVRTIIMGPCSATAQVHN
jgi:hypothetical protein